LSRMVRDRRDEPQRSSASETEAPIASLVVYLHREAHRCIASFSGALTAATRATIDGVADLLAGEQLVVFDFSRVDVIDTGGSDAVDVLVNSVRAHGGRFQIAESKGRMGASLRARVARNFRDSSTFVEQGRRQREGRR
jgi:MFS superfamily sulfate permease-like transporter